jgi:hypothetical protein
MKNIVIIVFFGCVVFVANLFITERKIIAEIEFRPVQSQHLILRENQRRVLMNELDILVKKNSDTIDSLKNKS